MVSRLAQTNMISIVIIAGLIIAMVSAAYVWAIPMVEKRISITDYNLMESLIIEIDEKIIEIANAGLGEATLTIPKGILKVHGYDVVGPVNNSIVVDFEMPQPIIAENNVPIKTSSLDHIGEYGRAKPRIIYLSRSIPDNFKKLNISMNYRELRSATPRGYQIALCPTVSGCSGTDQGGNEIRIFFDRTVTVPRAPANGGDLTLTYINIEVI